MPRVVHFEITAEDPESLTPFYEKTFGWTFDKWDGPIPYWLVMTGDTEKPGIDGGLSHRGDMGSNTVNTIDVPDIDEYIGKVTENGGEIIVPKMAVPGIGWMCYFKDPAGNVFGMIQMDESAK